MEVVSFLTFLEGKISELLFQIFFLSGIVFLLIFYDVDSSFIILSAVLFRRKSLFYGFHFKRNKKIHNALLILQMSFKRAIISQIFCQSRATFRTKPTIMR